MPAEGEYYWGDLVGLAVENEAGEALGAVAGLISTGAHDVLQVRDGEGEEAAERLIPFVAAYVLDVDLATRRIRVAWQKDW
jgi:16S rRNA processing protein RimM